MTLMFLALLASAPAAERGAVAAEHNRLTEEMRTHAARERWDAVDAHYRELTGLWGADVRYEDHWLGAQAASALGDVQTTWRRLQAALSVEFTDEALAWWATLTAQYGEVHLILKDTGPADHPDHRRPAAGAREAGDHRRRAGRAPGRGRVPRAAAAGAVSAGRAVL